ncbi:MAG: PQQ-dependent sugar dehydrogenase [Chloroflexota bacterium]
MRQPIILLLVFMLVACSGTGNTPNPTASSATLSPSPTAMPVATNPSPATATAESPTSQVVILTPTQISPTQTEPPTSVQGFPDSATYGWQPIVAGLQSPIGLANAGDGSGRLFVIEQPGRIKIIRDNLPLPTPFLDITDRAGSQGFEQGLLGLAFHPQYPQNGYFYVNYTDLQGNTIIARFQTSLEDPNRADPGSEARLLQIPQPYANHNGGSVVFGPDGYLYLGLGDGGSAGDPQGNGQSLNSLLGKILRIDVDHQHPYAIPPDNPFAGGGGKPEIWAYGLRNPWRFSFDRLTGDLYIGDVGQDEWEEINFLPAGSAGGANFGWNFMEGTHAYKGSPPASMNLMIPVAEYHHDQGCSVTGGVVYRGGRLPAWQGIYLYGDYCTGRIWGLLRGAQGDWRSTELFTGMGRITAFGTDEAGEIYLLDQSGSIYLLAGR